MIIFLYIVSWFLIKGHPHLSGGTSSALQHISQASTSSRCSRSTGTWIREDRTLCRGCISDAELLQWLCDHVPMRAAVILQSPHDCRWFLATQAVSRRCSKLLRQSVRSCACCSRSTPGCEGSSRTNSVTSASAPSTYAVNCATIGPKHIITITSPQ